MLRLRAYRPEDHEACLRVLDSNVPDYFLASDREEEARKAKERARERYATT